MSIISYSISGFIIVFIYNIFFHLEWFLVIVLCALWLLFWFLPLTFKSPNVSYQNSPVLHLGSRFIKTCINNQSNGSWEGVSQIVCQITCSSWESAQDYSGWRACPQTHYYWCHCNEFHGVLCSWAISCSFYCRETVQDLHLWPQLQIFSIFSVRCEGSCSFSVILTTAGGRCLLLKHCCFSSWRGQHNTW